MRLALGAGVGHQHIVVEPTGLAEHGTGNHDRVVERQFVDHVERRVVDAGQPLRELRTGLDFDLVRESFDHLAESRDVFLAISAGDQ